MLPSKGYFMDTKCIYFEERKCPRVYCHFIHDRQSANANAAAATATATAVEAITAGAASDEDCDGDDNDREAENEIVTSAYEPASVAASSTTTATATTRIADRKSTVKPSHIPVNIIPQNPIKSRKSNYTPFSNKNMVAYVPRPIVKSSGSNMASNILSYTPTSTETLRKRSLLLRNEMACRDTDLWNELDNWELDESLFEKRLETILASEVATVTATATATTTSATSTVVTMPKPMPTSTTTTTDATVTENKTITVTTAKSHRSESSKSSKSSSHSRSHSRSHSHSHSRSSSSRSSSSRSSSSRSSKKHSKSSSSHKSRSSSSSSSSRTSTSAVIKAETVPKITVKTEAESDPEPEVETIDFEPESLPEAEPNIEPEPDNQGIEVDAIPKTENKHLVSLLNNEQRPETIRRNETYDSQTIAVSAKKRVSHCQPEPAVPSADLPAPPKRIRNNVQATLYWRSMQAALGQQPQHWRKQGSYSSTAASSSQAPAIKPKTVVTILSPENTRLPYFERNQGLQNILIECRKLYEDGDNDNDNENENEAVERAKKEEKEVYDKCLSLKVYKYSIQLTLLRLRKEIAAKADTAGNTPGNRPRTTTDRFSITIKSSSIILNTFKINVLDFYNFLLEFVPDRRTLIDNNYPIPDETAIDRALVKNTRVSEKAMVMRERTCDRCGKTYKVNLRGFPEKRDECLYHPSRRIMKKGEVIFACCSGDSSTSGCCTAPLHVASGFDPNELVGFVRTQQSTANDDFYGIYALDCEMCYTTRGLELTRITVIDASLKVVLDKLVKPDNPVIDYNTKFSGITADTLKQTTEKLTNVQRELLAMFNSQTILIGHSLESDLKTLHLFHDNIVDTSLVFPHSAGPGKKRALRTLASEFLKKIIQNETTGHSSDEDAITCMELMYQKFLNKI